MLKFYKIPNIKHPGTLGHHEKTKPKNKGKEEEEYQLKGPENDFKKSTEKKNSNLSMEVTIKVQELRDHQID